MFIQELCPACNRPLFNGPVETDHEIVHVGCYQNFLVKNGNHRLTVIDLETGGLTPIYHSILEVAVVTLDWDLTEIDHWVSYVWEPDYHIDPEAIAVNHVDVERAQREGITAAEMLHEVNRRMFGATPVFHNAAFDAKFLNSRGAHISHAIDTLLMARGMWPRQKNGLSFVAERLGINHQVKMHSALVDARITGLVIQKMFNRFVIAGDSDKLLEPKEIMW
jgi:DNA polymerase III epsilon subunit-like protein